MNKHSGRTRLARHAARRASVRPCTGGALDEGERGGGAVSAPMAICALALVAVAGLAVDGVRAAQQVAHADALAEEAARAGGQILDPVALTAGTVVLDAEPAADAARAYLDAAARSTNRGAGSVSGVVTVTGPDRVRVEVTVRRAAVLLPLVGVDELVSTGSAEAVAVQVLPGDAP